MNYGLPVQCLKFHTFHKFARQTFLLDFRARGIKAQRGYKMVIFKKGYFFLLN